MVEADFVEMAAAGVRLIGEIGLGSVKSGADAAPMVAWGRANGMVSTYHTGGPSLPGSGAIGADAVLEANPHIAGHINGGTTSLPERDIARLVESDSGIALELVHCGNGRTALVALGRRGRGRGARAGSSSATTRRPGPASCPSGSCGSWPTWRRWVGVAPETVVCLATGNTARVHGLDVGVLAPGRAADLCIVDAPGRLGRRHGARCAGATATCSGSRWSSSMGRRSSAGAGTPPPAARAAEIVKGPAIGGGGH